MNRDAQHSGRMGTLEWVVIAIAIGLPWLAVMWMPGGRVPPALVFWMVTLLCLAVAWLIMSRRSERTPAVEQGPRMLLPSEQPAEVRAVMDVRFALEDHGARLFRGRLLESAEGAFGKLKRAFSPSVVPLVQEDERFGASVLLLPKPVEEAALEKKSPPWIHWVLFVATLATTTWVGAAQRGVNLIEEPGQFTMGLPYALGLLLILGVHELGHYFTARYHGMSVTPPYFIPVPFALGTFGAFIKMQSPPENRRMLFDVAIAGPLAGLLVAIPALWLGLQSSVVGVVRDSELGILGGTSVHSSILFAILAHLSLGDEVSYGAIVHLSPLAFAGWLGLFITALNLLPVGQLDGGHIARGMFGTRMGAAIGSVAMWSMFLLALFVWPGLMMWALIVFFLARRATPPLNDVTPISAGRRVLGWFGFFVLFTILTPMPRAFWDAAAIVCPYQ